MSRASLAWMAGLLAGMLAAGAWALPTTPADDAEVVQRLPARVDSATRRQRAALLRDPRQAPLAAATARAALQRARASGDPRELGLAQAALAPWWQAADVPAELRLLRAMVRQSQHDFDTALVDLTALAADARVPLAVQAQAGLTRATVLQVTGRLDDAQRACDTLTAARFAPLGRALSVPVRACLAELRSLRGEPAAAARSLAELARESPADRWLALVRAELAQRMGDKAAAETLFAQATAEAPEVYALASRADWLLEQGRPREALAALAAGDPDADALLLRRAIALRHLGDAAATAAMRQLADRFDAARLRGESLHAREEARLALDLQDQPARALALALENWARQKEPADALLLVRAARAAGRAPEAAEVEARVRAGWADVRLALTNKDARP